MKWIIVVLFSLQCAGGNMLAASARRNWNHYSIEIPASHSARDVTPAIADFELYEVVADDRRTRCMVYFGNAPAFPKYKWPDAPLAYRKDGRRVKEYAYSADTKKIEGLIEFPGLSYRGSDQSPYSFVHYYAESLDSIEAAAYARMIKSIVVVKRNLD
jgi:hypothetical protein